VKQPKGLFGVLLPLWVLQKNVFCCKKINFFAKPSLPKGREGGKGNRVEFYPKEHQASSEAREASFAKLIFILKSQ